MFSQILQNDMKAQFDFLGITFKVDYVLHKGDKADWEQPAYPDVYEIIRVAINSHDAMALIEPHWEQFNDEFTKYMTDNE